MTRDKRSYPITIKTYLATACIGLMTSTGYAAQTPATSNLVDEPMLPDTAIKGTNNNVESSVNSLSASPINIDQQPVQQSVSEPTRPAILRPITDQPPLVRPTPVTTQQIVAEPTHPATLVKQPVVKQPSIEQPAVIEPTSSNNELNSSDIVAKPVRTTTIETVENNQPDVNIVSPALNLTTPMLKPSPTLNTPRLPSSAIPSIDTTTPTKVTTNVNSADIQPSSQTAPISTSIANTTAKVAVANSEQLPNAYELVKRLEQQKLEMARMVDNVEQLQMEISDLKRLAKNPLPSSTERDLVGKVSSELQPMIQSQVEKQLNSKLSKVSISINPLNLSNANTAPTNTSIIPASQRPYLNPPTSNNTVQSTQNAANKNLANGINSNNSLNGNSQRLNNADIPKNSQNSANVLPSNSLAQSQNTQSEDKNAKLAYAAAYSALKKNGVQAGIQKMQYFINTYPNHRLIPNAHYWLGEFYLKDTPPNAQLAKQQFHQVITTFKNYDGNNKQSKALYRLATLSKNEGLSSQARTYVTTLFSEYPDSKEAKLANSATW